MIKHLKNIAEFNATRGLLDKGFNPKMENSFLLSEELETLYYQGIAQELDWYINDHDEMATRLIEMYGREYKDTDSKVEYCDKVIDHFFFGIGGMLKMGLNFKDIEDMFLAVEEANNAKSKIKKDGKVQKGEGFEAIDPKHFIRRLIESKDR